MPANRLSAVCGLMSLCLFAVAAAAQEKDKVQHKVSPARLESILQAMKIKYDKTASKMSGVHFYDFERNTFKVRLHNYDGRDLWIDVQFTDKISPEEVNQWNVRAKFSRAVLIKDGTKQSTSLETQIDCEGGITDGMIRQFILRFDGEVKSFVQFITK